MRIVLIGGVGGSGTRVIARAFSAHGIFIGRELNHSLDNLEWPGDIPLMLDVCQSHEQKVRKLRQRFLPFFGSMINEALSGPYDQTVLAVKVPGSFYYLPYLSECIPNLSYVHVIRSGLDMAFSSNLNQLNNWGIKFGLKRSAEIYDQSAQLKYWIAANTYARNHRETLPLESFYEVRFEDFCQAPYAGCQSLFQALNIQKTISEDYVGSIHLPASSGRYHQQDISVFEAQDLNTLSRWGYGS